MDVSAGILDNNQYSESLLHVACVPFSPQQQRMKTGHSQATSNPQKCSFHFALVFQPLKMRRNHIKSECLASLEKLRRSGNSESAFLHRNISWHTVVAVPNFPVCPISFPHPHSVLSYTQSTATPLGMAFWLKEEADHWLELPCPSKQATVI